MSKSKQINFFILPGELKIISTFFEKNECLIVRKDVPKKNALLEYNIISNEEKLFQVYIIKDQFKNNIYFKYLQSKDYYYLDVLSSYVLEFSIGGFYPYSDKELHRSRLYIINEYYEGQELVRKSSEFLDWAGSVMKNFQKQFLIKSSVCLNDYISEQCIKWVNLNNSKLESGGQKFITI